MRMMTPQAGRRAAIGALALSLAVPGTVFAQEPTSPPAVVVPDALGDVRTLEGASVPAPGFMDITALEIELDGDDLVATIRVAGDPSEAPNIFPRAMYTIWLSGPGLSSFSLSMVIPSADWGGMQGFGFDWEALDDVQLESDAIVVRVPRPELVAPEELTFAAMMQAMDLAVLADTDLFVRSSRHDETGAAAATSAPTPAPTMTTLEWEQLADYAPDTPTGSIVWTNFAGDTIDLPAEIDPEYRAPLNSASVTERILGQKSKHLDPPRMSPFRDELRTFIGTHEEALAELPAVDGVGPMDLGRDWLELPSLMARGSDEAHRSSDKRYVRTAASAVVAATMIYISDRTRDEALAADATRLADLAYDYGVAGIERSKRRKVIRQQRTTVDRLVRDVLEGFTDG